MSRMGFIKRHPKRSLSALATLLLALGLVVGSGAFFQSTDANTGNSVSTGNIDIEAFGGAPAKRQFDARTCNPREDANPGPVTTGSPAPFEGCYNSWNNPADSDSVSGGAVFEVSNLEPGQVVSKTARIENHGSLDANLFLKMTDSTGDSGLFDALYVRVKRISGGNTSIYKGPLNQLDDSWVDASGSDLISQNEAQNYEFAIKLPETGVDQSSLMSKSTTVQFTWLGRDQGAASPNTVAP